MNSDCRNILLSVCSLSSASSVRSNCFFSLLFFFFLIILSTRKLLSNKRPPHHFSLSPRTPSLTPEKKTATHSAQAPVAYTHKASRTTTVIDIRVLSGNPHVLQFTDKKNRKRSLHTHTHTQRTHTAVPTWQCAQVVALQNVAWLS